MLFRVKTAHTKADKLRSSVLLTALAVNALIAGSTMVLPSVQPAQAAADKTATSGVTDTEIIIGSCSGLESSISFICKQQLAGAKAYIDSVNDAGGINGRKIKLLTYNDGYDPQKAIQAFNQMVQDNAFAGAFFVGTPTASKYVPMAETHKIPLIGLLTGAQLLHEPFRSQVVSVRASYNDEAREQIDHLWQIGKRKIGVIYQDDAFGAAVLGGVRAALEKHQSAPVALGSFPRNTVDIANAISAVKSSNPDAVVLVGAYSPLAEVVKHAHAENWHPLFTTVSFVGTEPFIKAAGKDAEGTVITQVVPPYNRDDLATITLYKKLLKKYEPDEKPTFAGLEGFVDAMVLCQGLKKAGKDLTRAKFISAIESMHHEDIGLGPNLKLDFGPKDHKGFDSVYFTVVRNGEATAFTDWKQLK